MRRWRPRAALLPIVLFGLACGDAAPAPSPWPARSFRLGFAAVAPRPEIPLILSTIDVWAKRADVALMQMDVPWRALLADTGAALLVSRDQLPLASLYRGRGFPLVVMVEPENGLARDRESDALAGLGRSIAEPRVQAAYRAYVLAIDSLLRPEYLGLAIETNLIRQIAPAALYAGLRTVVDTTAAALRARRTAAKLLVSVQVDVAWGRLPAGGSYRGIATDLADFPFLDVVGLSSYPFLAGFARPEDVPGDWYARIGAEARRPVLVTEGGWSSASVPGSESSPDEQARWIARQMQLADSARALAVLQIPFTDLDMSAWGGVPEATTLALFAHLGLVDTQLKPKPALAVWDEAFRRPRVSP